MTQEYLVICLNCQANKSMCICGAWEPARVPVLRADRVHIPLTIVSGLLENTPDHELYAHYNDICAEIERRTKQEVPRAATPTDRARR